MNTNLVHNKIYLLADKPIKITAGRLRTLTLTNKNTPFKIWGSTIEGDRYDGREVFTFFGPSRNPGVGYNYNAYGYMIMYDTRLGDYRTFVYDLIDKLELNGITYTIN